MIRLDWLPAQGKLHADLRLIAGINNVIKAKPQGRRRKRRLLKERARKGKRLWVGDFEWTEQKLRGILPSDPTPPRSSSYYTAFDFLSRHH